MKIEVNENRNISMSGISGTMNENNIQQLEINVPEKYKDYNKKIVFTTDDGTVWDIIQDNVYTIKKNISKYRDVSFYIWLTKDEDDFRSKTYPLNFNKNEDASDEITDEEMGRVNTVINLLEEEIKKVTDLEKEVQVLVDDIQFKLDNGEFDGKDYVLTEEDKEKIVDTVKPMVEESIKPTITNINELANSAAQSAEHAEVIARGRATGYVFDTIEDLDIWLQDETNKSQLVIGDNFYIRATNVPDYWWDGEQKQQLEAEKPDFTNLVDKSAFQYDEETETLNINI